jgi:3-hydroxymyristoyl/3-hydroxydecanoyl-(acyl carrier protein) dehydratase
MSYETTVMISKDHPSLKGHFPGNPVVPGVVILGAVVDALRKETGPDVKVVGASTLKFLSPLRPDETMVISLDTECSGEVAFTCTSAGRAIAAGRLVYHTGAAGAGSQ